MTSVSSVFKQSLLVSAIGLVLGACAGGSGLSNNGSGTPTCETLGTCPPPPPPSCEETNTCPVGPGTSVRDFGGKNGKIVWDANHDWFAVGTDGKLYAYDFTKGWPSADSDTVPTSRLAEVQGVTVTSDNAIIYKDAAIGTVAPDTEAGSGEQFYVLSYGTVPEQGYLDIDYNKNYRGVVEGDKADVRITQIKSVAVQRSFQGLAGSNLWQAEDGDLVTGQQPELIAATDDSLSFDFTPATTENYQFVLRQFGNEDPVTDLDLRLVDTGTGRILGSSYTKLNGEVVSFPLVAGTTYGVNVTRQAGAADTTFLLSVKASPDDGSESIALPDLVSGTTTVLGTIQPITRFEFCSRFPISGWADASSDASSDATADSLFQALREPDTSSDSTGDASSDQPVFETQPDSDAFWFLSTNTDFLTKHTFRFIADGADALTALILTKPTGFVSTLTYPVLEGTPKEVTKKLTKGTSKVETEFSAASDESLDTIEYEMVIKKE